MTNPTTPFSWQMPTATDLVTDLPADFEVFGQAVATSMADLLGGTTGQILAKASNTNMDFAWITNDVGDITAVTASSPLTGGGTSGAITVGIQDATTSVKGAVQLSDSTSTTSSILAATPTAVKSAFDLATTANTNSNNITMVQQYTATESVLKNIPSRVPAAEQLLKQAVYWIDAAQSDNSDQVLDNQGWGAPALTTQLGSSASADSNDPKFLDFAGVNYVYLPGAVNNFLSIPDSAALDITGDIDVRWYGAMDDWSPTGGATLISKFTTSNQTFALNLNSTGTLQFYWSENGTTTKNALSTVANAITDGANKWIRATLDVDNGAVGNDVKFFTSDDNITYTQLGATVTTASVTSLYSGTANVEIGTNTNGGITPVAGKVYRGQIFNGIAGTKVLDVDTSIIGSGSATSFNALTGQTVTINRSTSGKKTAVVTSPVWLFGTDDYMEVADNDLIDFQATESFSVVAVIRQFSTPTSFGRYINKGNNLTAGPNYSVMSFGTGTTLNAQIADGTNTAARANLSTVTAGTITPIGIIVDRAAQTITSFANATISSTGSTTSVGAITSTLGLLVGASFSGTTPTNFQDFELVAAAVFRRALTAGEITTINNYYTARVG